MVTTNGSLLDRDTSFILVRSGLERLTVSFDGSVATHESIRNVDPVAILENIRTFREERDAAKSACALDVSMVVDGTTEPVMDEFREQFAGLADRIQFVPRFDSRPRSRACRELWRGVLVVLSNGDVTICCVDHQGKGVLGNVRDRMPVEWFNSEEMQTLRRQHLRGELPVLCANCGEYESPRLSPRF
jgi:MoaA/NifB/PqqE/SkfB family radical SAM enzyme